MKKLTLSMIAAALLSTGALAEDRLAYCEKLATYAEMLQIGRQTSKTIAASPSKNFELLKKAGYGEKELEIFRSVAQTVYWWPSFTPSTTVTEDVLGKCLGRS